MNENRKRGTSNNKILTAIAIASFFGRVNYNYQEKYMASVIMRADTLLAVNGTLDK